MKQTQRENASAASIRAIALLACLALCSCASAPPDAKTITAYANAAATAGTLVHNGIGDYKTIRRIERTP